MNNLFLYHSISYVGLYALYVATAFYPFPAFSQPNIDSLYGQIHQIVQSVDEESPFADQISASLVESLSYFIQNPIDLNTISLADLASFPLIDPILASQIIKYRETAGAFSSLSDLFLIDSVTFEFIQLIRPFVSFSFKVPTTAEDTIEKRAPGKAKANRKTVLSQSYSRRLKKPLGFNRPALEGGFYGTPAAFYTRFTSDAPYGISLRFAMEKDPGEAFNWSPRESQFGLDHIAMAASLKKKDAALEEILAGNYSLHFGQGLLFAAPFGSRKSVLPVSSTSRPFYRIRPGVSRSEGLYLHGVVAKLRLSPTFLSFLFISKRKRDASLTSTLDDLRPVVTSLPSTGLHRTETEISKRKVLQESLYGFTLTFSTTPLNLGCSVYASRYNHPFFSRVPPVNAPNFSGTRLSGGSVFGSLYLKESNVNWEYAKSHPGSSAFLISLLTQANRWLSLSILWRSYSQRYFSFYSNGFGERSGSPRNESGIYFGSTIAFSGKLKAFMFFDLYSFDQLSFSPVNKPRTGFESFIRLTYTPRPWISMYVQYRTEDSKIRAPFDHTSIHTLTSRSSKKTHRVALRSSYSHSASFQIKTHVEAKWGYLPESKDIGFLIYQDLVVFLSPATQVYLRNSIFDSKRNDTILYVFEKDLHYTYSIRSFSGQGIRSYIFFKHSFFNGIEIEFKYATTYYHEIINRGVGNNALRGRAFREVSTQLVWRF